MRVVLETIDGSQQVYNTRPYERGKEEDSITIYFSIQLSRPMAYGEDWTQDVSFMRGDRVFLRTSVSIEGLPLYKEDIRLCSLFREWDAMRKVLAEVRKERDALHKIVYHVDEGL